LRLSYSPLPPLSIHMAAAAVNEEAQHLK